MKHLRCFHTHVSQQTNDGMRMIHIKVHLLNAVLYSPETFHSYKYLRDETFQWHLLMIVSESFCAAFVTCAIYSDSFCYLHNVKDEEKIDRLTNET